MWQPPPVSSYHSVFWSPSRWPPQIACLLLGPVCKLGNCIETDWLYELSISKKKWGAEAHVVWSHLVVLDWVGWTLRPPCHILLIILSISGIIHEDNFNVGPAKAFLTHRFQANGILMLLHGIHICLDAIQVTQLLETPLLTHKCKQSEIKLQGTLGCRW